MWIECVDNCSLLMQKLQFFQLCILSNPSSVKHMTSMPSLLDWGCLCLVQVHFLINNLSTANLDSKSETLKDVLPREFWPWFSNYMVVKRAAQVRITQVDLYGLG